MAGAAAAATAAVLVAGAAAAVDHGWRLRFSRRGQDCVDEDFFQNQISMGVT